MYSCCRWVHIKCECSAILCAKYAGTCYRQVTFSRRACSYMASWCIANNHNAVPKDTTDAKNHTPLALLMTIGKLMTQNKYIHMLLQMCAGAKVTSGRLHQRGARQITRQQYNVPTLTETEDFIFLLSLPTVTRQSSSLLSFGRYTNSATKYCKTID